MVAFVILSAFLAVLYQSLSVGLASSSKSRDYAAAALVARSQLETIAAGPPGNRTLSGKADQRFIWQAVVRRELEDVRTEHDAALYRIRVTVRWGEPPSAVTLDTLQVMAGHVE